MVILSSLPNLICFDFQITALSLENFSCVAVALIVSYVIPDQDNKNEKKKKKKNRFSQPFEP